MTKTAPPDSISAHERVFRSLRQQIMHGELPPGEALTIRGIGASFGVSMTPAREAVRRLAAEGALTMTASGRVMTPELSGERLEELTRIRALLEPEMAALALPRVHPALIERMRSMNATVDQMVAKQDATGYVRSNLDFHRTLYLRAQAPAMLAIVETIWLQIGPTMRALYASLKRSGRLGHHREVLAALKAGDEAALRLAMREDVTQGLRMLLG